jgi:hypothetical protein
MIIRLSAGCSVTLATRGSSSANSQQAGELASTEEAKRVSRDFLKSNRRENLDIVFIRFSFQCKEVTRIEPAQLPGAPLDFQASILGNSRRLATSKQHRSAVSSTGFSGNPAQEKSKMLQIFLSDCLFGDLQAEPPTELAR